MRYKKEDWDANRVKHITVLITWAMMYEIDKYRTKHGVPTVSTAVYELIGKGLENENTEV